MSLDDDPRVVRQREHRAGLAVVHRAHRVEQVGADGDAGLDRLARGVEAGVGVAQGRDRRRAGESRATASSPWSSSGARVTMRTVPSAGVQQRGRPRRGRGRAAGSGSWAPQCAALSHGPSRWMPASSPARTSGASARTRRDEAVLGVGDEAGDERGRAVGAVRRDDRGRLGGVARREGGTRRRRGSAGRRSRGRGFRARCRSAGAGGVPPPAPVIRSPLVSTQPGSTSPAGRTTRSAVRITWVSPCFAGSVVEVHHERLLALLLAAGRPQVPLADDEPEQEVVEERRSRSRWG